MTRFTVLVTAMALAIFRLFGYFNEPRLTDAEIHAIVGEPAVAAVPPHRGPSLTVVSWNIERGVQFQKIASTLQALHPDVVLLQEVDRSCRRSGNHDVARELAHVLGMNWVSAGEFQEIGEARGTPAAVTGQAMLSREPITDARTIVFDEQSSLRWRINPMQPRRGGRIALRARSAGVLWYDLHLESGGGDEQRTRQLEQVLSDLSRESKAEPVVVAGDFNNAVAFQSFMFAGLQQAGLTDALGAVERQTSINHRHPIDWIFARGLRATAGRVERVEDASDHYPVVATLGSQTATRSTR